MSVLLNVFLCSSFTENSPKYGKNSILVFDITPEGHFVNPQKVNVFRDKLEEYLVDNKPKDVIVVDRQILHQIMQEKSMEKKNLAYIDVDEQIELGRLVGAAYIVYGSIHWTLLDGHDGFVKLVSTKDSTILGVWSVKKITWGQVMETVPRIGTGILKKIIE